MSSAQELFSPRFKPSFQASAFDPKGEKKSDEHRGQAESDDDFEKDEVI
jgi:hypothetical protein